MNKFKQIALGILPTLAPACALGIIVPKIVNNKSMYERFLNSTEHFHDAFKKSKYCYTSADINDKISGTYYDFATGITYSLSTINFRKSENDQTQDAIFSFDGGQTVWKSITMRTYAFDYIKRIETDPTVVKKYTITRDLVTFEYTKADGTYETMSLNSKGYMTNYELNESDIYHFKYSIDYLKGPTTLKPEA